MRKIKRIFVHCTAGSQKTTVKGLLEEFKRKGWRMPGYHWVVSPDGTCTSLLPESQVANGVYGYNGSSVHVAYIGGVDGNLKSMDNRTPEQKASLRSLLREIHARYPDAEILGHRDISPDKNGNGIVDPWERIKDCPCFEAKTEYGDL